jgi:hypothetical protein
MKNHSSISSCMIIRIRHSSFIHLTTANSNCEFHPVYLLTSLLRNLGVEFHYLSFIYYFHGFLISSQFVYSWKKDHYY